jgi:HlyD family secretion protein
MDQTAALKFSAFNQRTTPEADGIVSLVSADVTQPPALTGKASFAFRSSLARSQSSTKAATSSRGRRASA